MNRLAAVLIAALLVFAPLGGSGAFAAPILASATRTSAFTSTSTASVAVPLRNDVTTTMKFDTVLANQAVVIIYNAECVVTAVRGTRLSIKILVDGGEPEPSVGADFSLCSAVDASGQTYAAVVRQSVIKVPEPGSHTVKIIALLRGGTGSWRLDDTSLVVQKAHPAFATRGAAFQSTAATTAIQLEVKENGAKSLTFATTAPNELLKMTYNSECVLAASQPGKVVHVKIYVADAAAPATNATLLCHSVDTTGKTWAGAARELVMTIPEAGSHTAKIYGSLNVGPGTWRLDDSSLVITKEVVASAFNDIGISSSSTTEVAVPVELGGATALRFTTTEDNHVVKLTYNAVCRVHAERGRWLGIRIEVDDIEANPASGYDFALCSAVTPVFSNFVSGYRQSVITIPSAGIHDVRVFARLSASGDWGLSRMSLTVE